MLILLVSLFIIIILVLTLITIFKEEKRRESANAPTGRIMGYWSGAERRASIRVDTVLKTRYSVEKKPNQKKDSLSKNISMGGILIELSEKLAAPTLLLLEIFLPDDEKPVTAQGEVVWVKDIQKTDKSGRRIFDTGIKFVSMDSQNKDKLDKHIKSLI